MEIIRLQVCLLTSEDNLVLAAIRKTIKVLIPSRFLTGTLEQLVPRELPLRGPQGIMEKSKATGTRINSVT